MFLCVCKRSHLTRLRVCPQLSERLWEITKREREICFLWSFQRVSPSHSATERLFVSPGLQNLNSFNKIKTWDGINARVSPRSAISTVQPAGINHNKWGKWCYLFHGSHHLRRLCLGIDFRWVFSATTRRHRIAGWRANCWPENAVHRFHSDSPGQSLDCLSASTRYLERADRELHDGFVSHPGSALMCLLLLTRIACIMEAHFCRWKKRKEKYSRNLKKKKEKLRVSLTYQIKRWNDEIKGHNQDQKSKLWCRCAAQQWFERLTSQTILLWNQSDFCECN